MDEELASVARLTLAFGALGVLLFTVGALAGWRWGIRRVEQEPTWIFVAGQVGWGLLLLFLVLTPHPEGFGWLTWTTAAAVVAWLVALALQLRARAARSGNGQAP